MMFLLSVLFGASVLTATADRATSSALTDLIQRVTNKHVFACPYAPHDNVDRRELHRETRAQLWSQNGIGDNDAVLLYGGNTEYRGRSDTENPFFQESNFQYITGYSHEGGVALMEGRSSREFTTLFVREMSELEQIFDGRQSPPAETARHLGLDDGDYTRKLIESLRRLEKRPAGLRQLHVLDKEEVSRRSPEVAREFGRYLVTHTLETALFASRTLKTEKEQKLLRLSSQVSALAHNALNDVLSEVSDQINENDPLREYHLQGVFEFLHMRCGVFFQAYPPIVAFGTNAATMHYVGGTDRVLPRGLLLVDAGGSRDHYATDITRTMHVGKDTSQEGMDWRQRGIYAGVLAAQEQVLRRMRPGVTWGSLVDAARDAQLNALADLNIVYADQLETLRERVKQGDETAVALMQSLYFTFQPHGLGHHVGLDTHDVSIVPARAERLQTRMVLTVEPGIYFVDLLREKAERDDQLSQLINFEQWRVFESIGGVRIEDVILLTLDGYENLSKIARK